MTTWLPVVGHPAYEVSDDGRVRNVTTGRELALLRHDRGYVKVKLGRARYEYVHRLVCEAFHGPPELPTHHADHLNFDRADNRASNLRWLAATLNGTRWRHTVEDDAPPVDHQPLTAAEADQLDEQLAAQGGW